MEFDDACLPANGCTNPGEMRRVTFYNNLILLGDTTQPGYDKGYDFGGGIMHDLADFVVQHNTVIPPPNLGYCKASWYFEAVPPYTPPVSSTHNVWILDNVLCRQINGPRGYVRQFYNDLTDYKGDPHPVNASLYGNIFYATSQDLLYPVPPNNYVTHKPFTFVNAGAGNYQLSAQSSKDADDKALAGVDHATLAAHTATAY